MKLRATDPVACLAEIRETWAAIDAGDPVRALALYTERYPRLAGRRPLEWALVALLHRTRAAVPAAPPLPEDLLARPSGAALAFLVAQSAGEDLPLPPGLARRAAIPRFYQEAVAAAWLLRPHCSGLREPGARTAFALWLAAAPAAIGPCLLAAALLEDAELVGRLGPLWLERGIFNPGAPEQIERASRQPLLADLARQAVCTAVSLFRGDPGALLRLQSTAFFLHGFPSVVALGELLLLRRELREPERRQALALELGALAELDRHEEAVEQYRTRWLPTGQPFPHPERLLYVFQQRGEAALERQLLESADGGGEASAWVRLSRDLVLAGPPGRSGLEAWEALYRERRQDERILVGVSDAVLRSAPLLRQEWTERLGLLARWRALDEHA